MSRDSRRPKGYIQWAPKPEVAEIIQQVKAVLREYGTYGPMTVRQIFYRLVGQYGYDKTELAYKRLCEYLVKARRAQMISFAAIRDDGGTTRGGPSGYTSVDAFLEDMADWGTQFSLDATMGQPAVIELWCEAEGMVPMLAQMVGPWGVRVTGSGGFSSVTVTHQFAKRVLSRDVPTVLLHVGDYDPSGESIFWSMCQDIGSFIVGGEGGRWNSETGEVFELRESGRKDWFRPHRVALTADQVAEYDLPTAPPKASDSRSASWLGETTQAEALPPTLLEEIVVAAVQEHVDQDRIDELRLESREKRQLIGSRVEDAINALREDLS